jgi:type IV pilus assembly protein PilM
MSLFEWLGLRKPKILGIDVSSTTVKVIELIGGPADWTISGYAVVPLSDMAVPQPDVINVKLATAALQQALQSYPFKAKHAAIAIPSSASIAKVIQMPAFIKPDDLQAQVTLAAPKHIPYAIDEVHLDYQVLGPNAHTKEEIDVLLVAARSDVVDCRVKVVEAAGLEVEYVDVETYALERVLQNIPSMKQETGCVAIVDIGATTTNLCIFHKGKNVYMREQEFGGRQLTESIMQKYDMTYAQAGKAKRNNALPADYQETIFVPFQRALAQEIQRGLEFFYSATEYSSVNKILIGGATIQSQEIISVLNETIDVPIALINPLEGMGIKDPSLEKSLVNDAGALLICCGLGMRGVEE